MEPRAQHPHVLGAGQAAGGSGRGWCVRVRARDRGMPGAPSAWKCGSCPCLKRGPPCSRAARCGARRRSCSSAFRRPTTSKPAIRSSRSRRQPRLHARPRRRGCAPSASCVCVCGCVCAGACVCNVCHIALRAPWAPRAIALGHVWTRAHTRSTVTQTWAGLPETGEEKAGAERRAGSGARCCVAHVPSALGPNGA